MILVGQYDSPFVRRVGVALTLYEIPFEHRPWSVFGDGEKVRALNPLMRVPTLALDDGTALIDSHAILDHLDCLVGPSRAMFPREGAPRRESLKIAGLAMGAAELAVGLFYELRMHDRPSDALVARRRSQIRSALAALESDRAGRPADAWFGERIGHVDIAVAVALRFIGEAHPGLAAPADHPALARHATHHEALPAFQAISQPFVAPP